MYLLLVEEHTHGNISKDTCISNSTMIIDVGALDKIGESVERLCHFLIDILFCPINLASLYMHFDNKDLIGKAWSMMYNEKSRSI